MPLLPDGDVRVAPTIKEQSVDSGLLGATVSLSVAKVARAWHELVDTAHVFNHEPSQIIWAERGLVWRGDPWFARAVEEGSAAMADAAVDTEKRAKDTREREQIAKEILKTEGM